MPAPLQSPLHEQHETMRRSVGFVLYPLVLLATTYDTRLMIWLRFLVGGAIVALEPIIAQRFGNRIAGLALLFPTLIILSLLSIGQANGAQSVDKTAAAAMWGVPAQVVFLLTLLLLAQFVKHSYLLWIAGGVAAWLLASILILQIQK